MAINLKNSTRPAAQHFDVLCDLMGSDHRLGAFAPPERLTPSRFLAFCALRRGLRQVQDLWLDLPVLFAVRLPVGFPLGAASKAMEELGGLLDRRTVEGHWVSRTEVLQATDRDGRKEKADRSALRAAIDQSLKLHRRVIVLAEDGADIPSDVAAILDAVHTVDLPTADHYSAVLKRMGIRLRPEIISGLMAERFDLLETVLRPGTTERQLVRRLAERRSASGSTSLRKAADPAPTLDRLPGMGAAGEWGLALAADLRDWSAGRIPWSYVDRGILLHGGPGTGKTTFARALAQTCGVPLVAGSISRWQATGHLGDLLGSMRNAFKTAIAKAPAILFIDEVDSVGDRAEFSGDNKNYQTQVVNGLLECLDGVDGREGVVVVGACNDPTGIDPAIKRSGRLDRVLEIPLPDAVAREAILRLHLGSDLGASPLAALANRTAGWTGADLERIVREARRRARSDRRVLSLADLEACLPPLLPLSPEDLWRACVHEAGHAVVALFQGNVDVLAVHVERAVPAPGAGLGLQGGVVRVAPKDRVYFSERDCDADLALWLAGAAAEVEIIGDRSSGASGGVGSDLHRATLLATCMEAHWGMGPAPVRLADVGEKPLMKLLNADPTLRSRVETRVAERYETARRVIRENADVVRTMATILLERGALSGAEARAIMAGKQRATGTRATVKPAG